MPNEMPLSGRESRLTDVIHMVNFLNKIKEKGPIAEQKFDEFVSKLEERRKLEWRETYELEEERLDEEIKALSQNLYDLDSYFSDEGINLEEVETEVNNRKCKLFAFRNSKGGLTFIDPEDYNMVKDSKNIDKSNKIPQFIFTREMGLPSNLKYHTIQSPQPGTRRNNIKADNAELSAILDLSLDIEEDARKKILSQLTNSAKVKSKQLSLSKQASTSRYHPYR